jgi:hypothetical protein
MLMAEETIMNHYKNIVQKIQNDPRYRENLDWGKPRSGHPEGTVRAHIAELEQNLEALADTCTEDEYWKLMMLIHVHDSFKKDSKRNVAITDPHSHATLARLFLQSYCREADLLQMVQYHDESYALYRQSRHGRVNQRRLAALKERIRDWSLFLKFLVIDATTAGKDAEPMEFALNRLARPLGYEREMAGWLATCREALLQSSSRR